MKPAGLDGIDDLFFEHQIFDVGPGDDDSLFSGKAFGFADFKKAFDFLVDPADGLDLLFLVDRPGYGDALADGDIGQAGKNGVKLDCLIATGHFPVE